MTLNLAPENEAGTNRDSLLGGAFVCQSFELLSAKKAELWSL